MTKAFGYMRCSGDGQSMGDTWHRQQETIQKYADAHAITVVEWFKDSGIPGKTELENRPGLAALLAAVEANGVRTVLIEIPDRLARDVVVSEVLIREFQKAGCTVISASGNVDLTAGSDNNPTARFIRQVLAAVAELDKSLIVLKTRAARERIRAKLGKCEGRKAYGDWPGEQEVMDLIRRWTKEGLKPPAIRRLLNNMDFRTRYDKVWNDRQVYKLVQRERERETLSK